MKLKNPFKFLFNSVFSKLLIILIITGFLINLAVILFFRFGFSDQYRKPLRQNLHEHIHYLVEDMGTPADPEMAKYISLKTGINVFYKSGNVTWQTGSEELTFDTLRKIIDEKCLRKHFYGTKGELLERQVRKKSIINYLESRLDKVTDYDSAILLNQKLSKLKNRPEIKFGFYNRRLVVLYETEKESIIFINAKRFTDKVTTALAALLTGLTLIILVAWLMIRKILRPIKALSNGVEQVSSGDLTFRISQTGNDELGKLTAAFNEMTQQVKKMLHAKEELLIDISHELRSPVTRAKVAMEFLTESDTKKSIHDDIIEIETMINEILESARLTTDYGRPNKEETNILKLLQQVIKSDQGLIEKTKLMYIPEDLHLIIDPKQIKTVIRNILDNAIKYSDNEDNFVEVQYRYEENVSIIDIKDNGRGIHEEDLPYIFEPFYRVDKSRSKKTGGYGLGLSLCKNIVESHDGKIEASSVVGQGTLISLYFPEN